MPMPGTASNSASLWGQLVAIPFSARSPKIRNAGMFLRSASLRRQARKACSMRVSFSGSDAAVLVLRPGLGSTGGVWRSVRLTGFLLALALGNGPSSVLHNEEHRRSLIGGSPRWSKADSAVGNLLALFFEDSIRKLDEFCPGHGSKDFFEVVSAHLASGTKLGVQLAGRFVGDGLQGAQHSMKNCSFLSRRGSESLGNTLGGR